MTTGVKKGLNPARKVGSAPDSKGLSTYAIASGYATGLGKNDPVKLASDGTIVLASNDTADSIGVFMGVSYVDSQGNVVYSKNWPASTVATNIEALVMDDPNSTFTAKAEGPIPLVQKGDIFALNLTAPDTVTGQSTVTVKTNAEIVGDVDLNGETDIGANVAGVADGDAFSIRTSNPDNSAVTITIADGDGLVELLAKLNAVDGILASEQASTGFLVIEATDGYDIITAEVTNTPFAGLFAGSAGTFSEVVSASAGLVKVIRVIDETARALEVVLVDHDLRDDG